MTPQQPSQQIRTPVRPGRILVVSQTYGNDAAAAISVSDWNRPWQTLAAALVAATSGDTIHVLDGNYTTEPTLVLKDGVHWQFAAGASFTGTFSDAASSPANPSCAISALGDGLSIATLSKSGSGVITLSTPTKFNRDVAFTGNVSLGALTTTGNVSLGPSGALIFEGSTADAYETTLTVVDPTADRTITLPNADATLVGGAYTAAATGDAAGLTSGTLPDARLSGTYSNSLVLANNQLRLGGSADGVSFNSEVASGLLIKSNGTRSGIEIISPSGNATFRMFAADAGGNIGYLVGGPDSLILQVSSAGNILQLLPEGATTYGSKWFATYDLRVGPPTGDANGTTNGTPVRGIRSATAVWDCPSTNSGVTASTPISVPGVTTTGTPSVLVTVSDPLQFVGFVLFAAVTSADTVTVYAHNTILATLNPGSVTVRVTVLNFSI